MGSILNLTDRGLEALSYYRRALSEAPKNANVHFVYGQGLLKVGKTDEALRVLTVGRPFVSGDARLRKQFDEALARARVGSRGGSRE